MASAVARAHSRLLVVLEHGSQLDEDEVSQLADEAAELLVFVARLGKKFGTAGNEERAWLADQLASWFACYEEAVLAGEVTYNVWAEQAEEPAARTRRAVAHLARDARASEAELHSLRVAAVDLAALLIRTAANARANRLAREAPEQRTTSLTETVHAVTGELTARAQQYPRSTRDRADVVAHHLASGLRLRVPQEPLRDLGPDSSDKHSIPTARAGLRSAWVALATHEYLAVANLDSQVNKPTYAKRFASLPEAIAESATTVICGARLLGRPDAFRHRRAWRKQAVALTYALEAYVAGLRGHPPSLARAQAITLTRLVRATVAITTIDLVGAQAQPVTRRH
jgi:hypothetical protein